jgi:hypothetical protein
VPSAAYWYLTAPSSAVLGRSSVLSLAGTIDGYIGYGYTFKGLGRVVLADGFQPVKVQFTFQDAVSADIPASATILCFGIAFYGTGILLVSVLHRL